MTRITISVDGTKVSLKVEVKKPPGDPTSAAFETFAAEIIAKAVKEQMEFMRDQIKPGG